MIPNSIEHKYKYFGLCRPLIRKNRPRQKNKGNSIAYRDVNRVEDRCGRGQIESETYQNSIGGVSDFVFNRL